MPQSYQDLIAWQKAMTLAELVYAATESFPKREIFGLSSQLCRAAVSIPSNIAEGQARYSRREFRHFLRTAKGSLAELDTQLLLSVELGFAQQADVDPALNEIDELQKMLVALKRKLSSFSPLATRHSPLSSRAGYAK